MTAARRTSRPAVCAAIIAVVLAGSLSAAQPQAARITITAAVDRPAVWVADRLTYTIDIICRDGVDVVVDDLAPEKLQLRGLEVVGSDNQRRAEGGVIRYQFRYVLTTYRVDLPTLSIAALPVRYYVARPGQRGADTAPAGTALAEGTTVAFRSLLPDGQLSYPPRDGRAPAARWLPYRLLPWAGLGLILLSAAPLVMLGAGALHRARRRRGEAVQRPARMPRRAARARFDEIREADPPTTEARRDAFAQLDGLIRDHLTAVCAMPAAALTPAEVATSLASCTGRLPVELVSAVLVTCAQARYAGPDSLPSADAWREALRQADQILTAGR